MKYYTMVEMAKIIGIPESTARGYRDRFPSFMITYGQGRNKRYTNETLEALRIVATMSRAGTTFEDIEAALEARFGIAIESQDAQGNSRESQSQRAVSHSRNAVGILAPDEIKELFKEAVQEATASLHNEIAALKAELATPDDLREQNEAFKKELEDLKAELKAIETRQEAREASHYEKVDKYLSELKKEPQKGFFKRLFSK